MVIKALASDGSNAERETTVSATSDDVLTASNAPEQTLLCFISGVGCLIPIILDPAIETGIFQHEGKTRRTAGIQ